MLPSGIRLHDAERTEHHITRKGSDRDIMPRIWEILSMYHKVN